MWKRLFLMSVIFFVPLSFSLADSGPDMQEGLWEITTRLHMQGMNMPPMTQTQCLTKENMVPIGSERSQDCEITNMETSGNTVTWAMSCPSPQGETTGTGRITYHGDTFEGEFTMKNPASGPEITTRMTGRRIGDCNAR